MKYFLASSSAPPVPSYVNMCLSRDVFFYCIEKKLSTYEIDSGSLVKFIDFCFILFKLNWLSVKVH